MTTHADRAPAGTLHVLGGPARGQVWHLGPGAHVLGRAADSDLRVNDPGVSRRHCRVVVAGHPDAVTIEDLGSGNGTLVDGVWARGPIPLRPGARVVVGKSTLSWTPSDLRPPAPPRRVPPPPAAGPPTSQAPTASPPPSPMLAAAAPSASPVGAATPPSSRHVAAGGQPVSRVAAAPRPMSRPSVSSQVVAPAPSMSSVVAVGPRTSSPAAAAAGPGPSPTVAAAARRPQQVPVHVGEADRPSHGLVASAQQASAALEPSTVRLPVPRRIRLPRSASPPRPEARSALLSTVTILGALATLAVLGVLTGLPLLFPPLAASMALIAAGSALPLAQPRNVVGGHVLSALVGFAVIALIGSGAWAAALAGACALGVMLLLRMSHSPAVGTAVIVGATAPAAPLFLEVLLLAAMILLVFGIVGARLEGKKYPVYWW